MCELLGVSADRAWDARPWLCRFRARGGEVADNADGWGLAYRQDGVLRLHKAPTAGGRDPVFGALCATVRSALILGHVRHARHPRINSLDNTHPFIRTCCGREWVFAHNGLVPEIMHGPGTRLRGVCRPRGETDSEYAFCYLLEYLASRVQPGAEHDRTSWFEDVVSAAGAVAAHGKFNFLMSDGDYLIAYGHDRLHHLELTTGKARAILVATEPLSEAGAWETFAPGELRIYRAGAAVARAVTRTPFQGAADGSVLTASPAAGSVL